MSIAGRTRLTPLFVERQLVQHYLRSDGAWGGEPLTHLDATPAEITVALELGAASDEEARCAFVDHFDLAEVRDWLSGRRQRSSLPADCPGYFRFLVLSCLVVGTEEGAGASHNFRERLGRLLGEDGGFSQVAGLNDLWRRLAHWCNNQRAAGQPIRRIVLPNPGSMTLIGCSVKLAFPSWLDRRRLTDVLDRISFKIKENPGRLIDELERVVYQERLTEPLLKALTEFATEWRAGHRLLSGHRFWRLVQNVMSHGVDGGKATVSGKDSWRLVVLFSGYEQDELHAWLYLNENDEEPRSVDILVAEPEDDWPTALCGAREAGVLVLREGLQRTWEARAGGLTSHARVVVLVKDEVARRSSFDLSGWRPVSEGWWVSSPMSPGDAASLPFETHALAKAGEDIVQLSVESGVKTGRDAWLGRPGCLPYVLASAASRVRVEPISDSSMLRLRCEGEVPRWRLRADAPIEGHWRIVAKEADRTVDRPLVLERDARVRDEFSEPAGYERASEVAFQSGDELFPRSGPKPSPSSDFEMEARVEDCLEVVYAAPASGWWREAELVPLLATMLPREHLVWDFLGALAEAGWLTPMRSRSWGSRVWCLNAPTLVPADSEYVVIEGAVGSRARRFLESEARRLGGRVLLHAPAPGMWTAPVMSIEGVAAEDLSRATGWRISRALDIAIARAPECWIPEAGSDERHLVVGRWSFDRGLFLPVSDPDVGPDRGHVVLERMSRKRGDAHDIFRVRGRGPKFFGRSRTSAILEAYRRQGVPMFAYCDGMLLRLARDGRLPLPVGRKLRRLFMRPTGPIVCDNSTIGYRYPCDDARASWLSGVFGRAIDVEVDEQSVPLVVRAGGARRLARRFSWYEDTLAKASDYRI